MHKVWTAGEKEGSAEIFGDYVDIEVVLDPGLSRTFLPIYSKKIQGKLIFTGNDCESQ